MFPRFFCLRASATPLDPVHARAGARPDGPAEHTIIAKERHRTLVEKALVLNPARESGSDDNTRWRRT